MASIKDIAREETFKLVENPSRRMLVPYTMGAKYAQFPYRWHWHNSRFFRQMFFVTPFVLYIFHKISLQLNSDANKEEWAKTRGKRVNHWFDPVAE